MKDFKLPLKLAIECCDRENKDMQADEASLKQYNKMTAEHKLTTDVKFKTECMLDCCKEREY